MNTSTLTDTVSDAVTSSAAAVQDLAATAVELASELPDRATELATIARDRIGGRPSPRAVRPWMIVAVAAVASILAVGWWMRRRRPTPAVDIGADGRVNPARDHTGRAAAAAH